MASKNPQSTKAIKKHTKIKKKEQNRSTKDKNYNERQTDGQRDKYEVGKKVNAALTGQ